MFFFVIFTMHVPYVWHVLFQRRLHVSVKMKLPLYLIKYNTIKAYEGVEVYLLALLTSLLNGDVRSPSYLCQFTPEGKNHGFH